VKALLSVYDKTGLVKLAESLGVRLLGSRSTAKIIREANINAEHVLIPITSIRVLNVCSRDATSITAHEMLGGHAKIPHLAERDLADQSISKIDIVVCIVQPLSVFCHHLETRLHVRGCH